MSIGVGLGVGAGGSGGGGIEFTFDPSTIAAGKTGGVGVLRAALAGTVSYTALAGSNAALAVDSATGTVTLGTAQGEATTLTLDVLAKSSADIAAKRFTVVVGPPDLALSAATYAVGASSGTQIGTFTLGAGETMASMQPNDGRLAFGAGGTTLVRGLSASSAGSTDYIFTTNKGRTLTATIIASAAATTQTFSNANAASTWSLMRYVDGVRVYVTEQLQGRASYRSAYVKGSTARMLAFGDAPSAGLVQVSVDGGAFFNLAGDGTGAPFGQAGYTGCPVFAGLSDAQHLVTWRIGGGYGNVADFTDRQLFLVTGSAPAVEELGNWQDFDSPTVATASLTRNRNPAADFFDTNTTGQLPINRIEPRTAGNVITMAVRGDITELYVSGMVAGNWIALGRDDGTLTYHQSVNGGVRVITGLSGLHNYVVSISGGGMNGVRIAAVGGKLASGAFVAPTITRKFDQFGDSITAGVDATGPVHTDAFLVAAKAGMIANIFGVPGIQIAQFNDTVIDPIIAAAAAGSAPITSNDVAVIALGRNNVQTAWTSTETTSYTAIINKLLGAGYGKVICRGILQDHGTTYPGHNGQIQSIVAGLADARVKFVDTSSWTGVQNYDDGTNDRDTHPTDAGYVTIANYAYPAYLAAGL